ncbi:hypothetical protein EEI76_22255 (plasmid) [Enterobacter cloacae]|nr:hypothetical protein EEI76_22255 [Enterobacter cloacae]
MICSRGKSFLFGAALTDIVILRLVSELSELIGTFYLDLRPVYPARYGLNNNLFDCFNFKLFGITLTVHGHLS